MKTIKKQINLALVIIITIMISFTIHAQKSTNKKQIFLRVYNLEGKKISKGKIVSMNDSILELNNGGKEIKIEIAEIGGVKTKRSGGHNVIIGAASGILFGAVLGSVNPPTDSSPGTFTWAGGSSGEEFTSGVTVGVISGTIIGGVTSAFKNSKTYSINGDIEKWKIFEEAIKRLMFK